MCKYTNLNSWWMPTNSAVSVLFSWSPSFVYVIQHLGLRANTSLICLWLRSELWLYTIRLITLAHCIFAAFFIGKPDQAQHLSCLSVILSTCFRSVSCRKNRFSPTSQLFCIMNKSCCPPGFFSILLHWIYRIPRACYRKISTCLMSVKHSVYSVAPLKPSCEPVEIYFSSSLSHKHW